MTDAEISNLKPMEEAQCAGSGALFEAAKGAHAELARYLLSHGALDYDNRALAVIVEVYIILFKICLLLLMTEQSAIIDPLYKIAHFNKRGCRNA